MFTSLNDNLVTINVPYSLADGVTVHELSIKCKNNRVVVQVAARLVNAIGTEQKTILTLNNYRPSQIIRFIVHTGDYAYNAVNAGYGVLGIDGKLDIKANNGSDVAFILNFTYDI